MNNVLFNEKDENLDQIIPLTGLNNFNLTRNYRVHGLKNEERPPVLIEFGELFKLEEFDFLTNLFKDKIKVDIKPLVGENKHSIYIGLRLDLRQNQKLSAAILKTIVLYLEKLLAVKKNKKVVIPVFA